MDDLLNRSELPSWFIYPSEFLNVVNDGVVDIGPWQFLTGQWLRVRILGLRKRFPDRELVPFARRLDSDDVACWDGHSLGAVSVVHDFCAPGWEKRESFDSFAAWYQSAQTEAENYDE
jgi:hypothetical protein